MPPSLSSTSGCLRSSPHGEAATLTSTLKLKRNVVNKMYASVIEEGYKQQTAKFAARKK